MHIEKSGVQRDVLVFAKVSVFAFQTSNILKQSKRNNTRFTEAHDV